MNLEKPCNKYKKLLCKNDIIFLVGFGLFFVLIYGFSTRYIYYSIGISFVG